MCLAYTSFAVCIWLVGTRYRLAWLWFSRKSLVRRTAFARLNPTIPPVAQPEQLAAAITWLLSDDSANVNGAVLPSDGGWSVV